MIWVSFKGDMQMGRFVLFVDYKKFDLEMRNGACGDQSSLHPLLCKIPEELWTMMDSYSWKLQDGAAAEAKGAMEEREEVSGYRL